MIDNFSLNFISDNSFYILFVLIGRILEKKFDIVVSNFIFSLWWSWFIGGWLWNKKWQKEENWNKSSSYEKEKW